MHCSGRHTFINGGIVNFNRLQYRFCKENYRFILIPFLRLNNWGTEKLNISLVSSKSVVPNLLTIATHLLNN